MKLNILFVEVDIMRLDLIKDRVDIVDSGHVLRSRPKNGPIKY